MRQILQNLSKSQSARILLDSVPVPITNEGRTLVKHEAQSFWCCAQGTPGRAVQDALVLILATRAAIGPTAER
jgi:hypothetical protein